MTGRYESLTVRFTYGPVPARDERTLDGFLENLKIPLSAMLLNYMDRGAREILLRFRPTEAGLETVLEVTVPADADTLAEHIGSTVTKLIEDTFGMFPDRIDIIYRSEDERDCTVKFSGRIAKTGDKLIIIIPKRLHDAVLGLGEFVSVTISRYGCGNEK